MNKIGFIGAGQMAKAMAVGIAKANSGIEFLISDPSEAALAGFESAVGKTAVVTRGDTQGIVDGSEMVCLAVKPQYVADALQDIKFKTNQLIVSVVAGLRSYTIERITGCDRVVRVMPNTPCLIGYGATGYAPSESVEAKDIATVESYLKSLGTAVNVSEDLLDSVTGVSGSGPAYVFTFIEAMIDGAVLTGMARSTARELAIQTVIGSAKMLEQSGEHPAVLRDRVTSPGGTTIEALKALEENSFRDAVMSAVQIATEKSRDLAQ